MKLNRCPVCHSLFDVMTLAQDEATRELLSKLATFDTLTGAALLGYLSLFCPPKSQLTAAKSLSLINEIDALANGDWSAMAVAMDATVQTMWAKKHKNETVGQFKNHNYLMKVFADVDTTAIASVAPVGGMPSAVPRSDNKPKSKTRGAIEALEALKHE